MIERDFVVLVDESGNDLFNPDGTIATMEKIEAHCHGFLHRAISVFIFNERNELLLQKRAVRKYHSPNKWTNTCCTHPSPGETPLATAQRRLGEEMGLTAALAEVFTTCYRVDTGNGLIENEFDHVFFGLSSQNPKPNPAEVSDWKWVALEELEEDLRRNAESYSPWLGRCFGEVIKHKSHFLG